MKQLISTVKGGTLTDEQKRAIGEFAKDEQGRIEICNLDQMYDAIIPTGYKIDSISWYGVSYCYDLVVGTEKYGFFTVVDKEEFDKRLRERDIRTSANPDYVTITNVEQTADGKEITFYETSVGKFKSVKYTLSKDGKEFTILKDYCLEYYNTKYGEMLGFNIGNDIPDSTHILGTQHGQYFSISLYSLESDTSEEI